MRVALKVYSRRMPAVACAVLVLIAIGPLATASLVWGEARVLGEITTATASSPGITGLVFDGQREPLVFDGLGWAVNRISLDDAHILQSTAINQQIAGNYGFGLAYRRATGGYYTGYWDNAGVTLTRLNLQSATRQLMPLRIGMTQNFMNLAFDKSDHLWLSCRREATDELWQVDPDTGVGTVRTAIHLPHLGWTATAMTNANGRFFVNGYDGASALPDKIFELNPQTGLTTTIITLPFSGPRFLNSLAWSAQDDKFYGVLEDRQTSPFKFYLVELTDMPGMLPEPGGVMLVLLLSCRSVQRKKRCLA